MVVRDDSSTEGFDVLDVGNVDVDEFDDATAFIIAPVGARLVFGFVKCSDGGFGAIVILSV